MYTELEPITRQEIRKGTVWSIAFGILLIILGVTAMSLPFATAIELSLILGWLFILGGAAQIVYAFISRVAGTFIWKLLLGVFYIISGILVLFSPGIAAVTLSLLLGFSILTQSITQIIHAFQMRPEQGWGWILFSGIGGIILGFLILAEWPFGAVWLFGVWFGINLSFDGLGIVMMSSMVRSAVRE